MAREKKRELRNRLNAYSATIQSSTKAVLKHTAENWPRYAAVASSALAMATNGSASIIYSGTQNLTAKVASAPPGPGTVSNHSHKSVALLPGIGFGIQVEQTHVSATGFDTARVFQLGGLEFLAKSAGAPGSESLKKLGAGVKISTAPGFWQGAFPPILATKGFGFFSGSDKNWPADEDGYAAFRFKTGGGVTDYGWVQLIYEDEPSGDMGPFEIEAIDWAYATDGGAITTGEVPPPPSTPEPSTAALALLASGAAGVEVLRRRRRKSTV